MVPSELNDIWGWVDSSGNEYAIVGMNNGTSIIDLSDPLSPQEVLFVPGMNSIWRDIKTYGHYAYVTTDNPSTSFSSLTAFVTMLESMFSSPSSGIFTITP